MGHNTIISRYIAIWCMLWYIAIFKIVQWKGKARYKLLCRIWVAFIYHITLYQLFSRQIESKQYKISFPVYLNGIWKLPSYIAGVTSTWKMKCRCTLALKLDKLKQRPHRNWKYENKVRKCSFVSLSFKAGFWQGLHDTTRITIHGTQYNTDVTKINIAIYCQINILALP